MLCISSRAYVFFSSLLFFRSMLLLVLSGDIETNPGPDPGYLRDFLFVTGT